VSVMQERAMQKWAEQLRSFRYCTHPRGMADLIDHAQLAKCMCASGAVLVARFDDGPARCVCLFRLLTTRRRKAPTAEKRHTQQVTAAARRGWHAVCECSEHVSWTNETGGCYHLSNGG
jgi:hypothetical protein